MKVLIPYDGTKNAENALLDLQNAGFGKADEITIVITDVFLPESAEEFFKAKKERLLNLEKSGTCSFALALRRFEEERFLSCQIRQRLYDFPVLNIRIGTLPGNSLVSSELLEKAARWKADLIILGVREANKTEAVNNGYKSGLWRIVSNAECAVRLAFGTNRNENFSGPDHVFPTATKNSAEVQMPEKQTISGGIGETVWEHADHSTEIALSFEKIEQVPKFAVIGQQRQSKSRCELKHLARTAAISI